MAAAGAAVAVADVNEHAAAAMADEIAGDGGVAMAVTVDVSDEEQVAAMVAAVTGAWGSVSILANVATVTDRAHQAADGSVSDAQVSIWERTLAVDLIGSMLTSKHVVPVMVSAGKGAVVNVSSNASLYGDATLSAYAAAKAGVNALTRSIAAAYGKQGVRANTVSPAAIAGPSFTANVPAESRK